MKDVVDECAMPLLWRVACLHCKGDGRRQRAEIEGLLVDCQGGVCMSIYVGELNLTHASFGVCDLFK